MKLEKPKITHYGIGYPTVEYQEYVHLKSQQDLENLRKEMGDKEFFITSMLCLSTYGNKKNVTTHTVAEACKEYPKYLLFYMKMSESDQNKEI